MLQNNQSFRSDESILSASNYEGIIEPEPVLPGRQESQIIGAPPIPPHAMGKDQKRSRDEEDPNDYPEGMNIEFVLSQLQVLFFLVGNGETGREKPQSKKGRRATEGQAMPEPLLVDSLPVIFSMRAYWLCLGSRWRPETDR